MRREELPHSAGAKATEQREGKAPHEVFVSYSHEDAQQVEPLIALIQQRGFTAWWDQRLRVGDEFPAEIEDAISTARATVVCWSDSSVSKPWVIAEATLALQRSSLLPIALHGCPPPEDFAHLQTLAITSTDRVDSAVLELTHRISDLCGHPGADAPDVSWTDVLSSFPEGHRLELEGVVLNEIVCWTKDHRPYVDLTLDTLAGEIACRRWNTDELPGAYSFVHVKGRVIEHLGRRRLGVEQIGTVEVRPAPGRRALLAYLLRHVEAGDQSSWSLDGKDGTTVLLEAGQESIVSVQPGSFVPLVAPLSDGDRSTLVGHVLRRSAQPVLMGYPLVRLPDGKLEPLAVMPIDVFRSARSDSGFTLRSTGAGVQWSEKGLRRAGLQLEDLRDLPADAPGIELIRALVDGNERLSSRVIDPEHLADKATGHLVNHAAIFSPSAGPMTKVLRQDVEALRQWPEGAIASSPLGVLLDGLPEVERPLGALAEGPAIGPASLAQDEANLRALHHRLTVVTGPPGTGKSQLIANIVAAAIKGGERVVVASTNNAAVDVVAERASVQGGSLVVRCGPSDKDGEAADMIAAHLRWIRGGASLTPATMPSDGGYPAHPAHLYARATARRQDEVNLGRLERAVSALEVDVPPALVVAARSERREQLAHLFDEHLALVEARGQIQAWRFLRRRRASREISAARDNSCRQLGLSAQDITAPMWSRVLELLKADSEHSQVLARLAGTPTIAQLDDEVTEWFGPTRAERRSQAAASAISSRAAQATAAAVEAAAGLVTGLRSTSFKAVDRHRLVSEAASALPALCVTLHSAGRFLAMEAASIDLVVIDEASQCHLSAAAPLLARARRAVVIGDPHQLPVVETLTALDRALLATRVGLDADDRARFAGTSTLFDHAAAAVDGETVFLDGHFRCHPDIANFVNRTFYENKMTVRTEIRPPVPGPALAWFDCRIGDQPSIGNTNTAEADLAVDIAESMLKRHRLSTGIISPFKAQVRLIKEELTKRGLSDQIRVGTVHAFQGDERSAIIFSPVLSSGRSSGRRRFVEDPQLVNVALTRAKEVFLVVGDKCAFTSATSPLGSLREEVERLERLYSTAQR